MKWKHSYDSVFHCRQGQCDRMYSNIYSYQRHMLMKHVSDFNAPLNESDKIPFHSTSVNTAVFSCENVFIEPKFADNSGRLEKDSSIINTTLEMFSKVLHTSALQFVSKLYSQYNLPRNIVQQFVNDVSLMFSNASQNILQCKLFSISESEKSSDLIEIQNMISLLQEPFHMFETEHARFKYFQESGTFVKPESFVIDDEPILTNTDNRIQFDNKKHMASFICPSLTLKAFLELPNVFQNITEYVNSLTSKTSISNIVQTDLWKNILKHFPAKIVFPISLYFADFELNNPLGTHAGTYKVGAVYYSIPCLPPQYVSQLENIFLAQLHHTADLQKYDNTRVFSRLLRSFKQLEQNGIVISVDNLETNVYFIVILILGDNLGIHKMFGFHESFNSNNYCRFCRASKTVAATQITEHDATIRTVENYNVDLYDNQCGIKDDCIFNELQHFHCVLNTGVDIMHDIYEGICRYDIGHILSYYIYEKRYFTINHLNHNLKCFNFCNENKPPLISEVQVKKKYIMFSASEMKSFIRVFGVLIGEFIPVNDLVWDLYNLLRQICEIVEQNTISLDDASLLKTLIAEHHEIYISCFGRLKPKHHFLIHYPRIMNTIGPLANISCFRFEGKHRMFKLNAKSVISRINITYTLALKNQLHFNYKILSNTGFQDNTILGQTISYYNLNNCIFKDVIISDYLPDDIPQTICSISWIKNLGVRFRAGLYVPLEFINFCPTFGLIKEILTLNEKDIFFVVQMYETLHFDEHFQSYVVIETNTTRCVNMLDLICRNAFSAHTLPNGRKCLQI